MFLKYCLVVLMSYNLFSCERLESIYLLPIVKSYQDDINFIQILEQLSEDDSTDPNIYTLNDIMKKYNSEYMISRLLIKKELISMFISNNENQSKVAAFFLGFFDYYAIAINQNIANAKRFFEFAYQGNENLYIKNWAAYYLCLVLVDMNVEINKNVLLLFERIDISYLNEVQKLKLQNILQKLKNKLKEI